ncbi:hypothetical protein K469DRAFT_718747 [Zopfia rhizophila CBS 207.26]|uniref:Uncharacterized protein n=1 Tax=Zopfia rhizophila CBS 207.26 TaxID=1314779 RepID=A0A6A6DBY0_9PEZI|nr:hypothetical protein K469DRAFT_702160 [Zopfia rhizophila CBS 207.26]KAF2175653.1 hypothetical protein K469DRAFT_701566 [Zopfia rhizophila CBS 207.26]KAF2191716.1 hypothetical protein K469DRAFT_718747 [Zopfia rhizophila CBS 207.26]
MALELDLEPPDCDSRLASFWSLLSMNSGSLSMNSVASLFAQVLIVLVRRVVVDLGCWSLRGKWSYAAAQVDVHRSLIISGR